MFDLFGLGKKEEAPAEQTAPAAEPAPGHDERTTAPKAEGASRGSHKLWAFLLVLDSVFVIVFAGAVAAKVFQHWNAPAVAPVPNPRRRPAKEAVPTPPPAPAPEPAKAPEPPKEAPKPVETKKPEPVKPEPKTPEGMRPPKPSMLTEAPKHREVKPSEVGAHSAPAKAAPAPVTAPAPTDVRKAVRTEFHVRAPGAKNVELVGAFIVRGGRKEMNRGADGTWTVTLYLNPGSYRYFFSVDKKKQLDPENPHSEKGASLLSIP